MSETQTQQPETNYEVFDVGATTVAMISEVMNQRAWIQSSVVMPVEP